MKTNQDAYGQALYAFYQGNGVSVFIERDDGHIDADWALKRYFSRFRQWQPSERQAIALCRGRILDIGCGAGRHALHLQEKGFLYLCPPKKWRAF